VRVLDLESDGAPDVVLSLSGYGGARCCLVEQVFSFDPAAGTYVVSEHNFTATGAGIADLLHNGRFEFLSSDPWFFGAFADLAMSVEPIQIWSFRRLRFINVTCDHYVKLIARDADRSLDEFNHHLSSGEGYLAAWAADEDLLGHDHVVHAFLAQQLREDRLHGTNFTSGTKFIAALDRFLRRHGYQRGCRSSKVTAPQPPYGSAALATTPQAPRSRPPRPAPIA
jgi:hypothetical protein